MKEYNLDKTAKKVGKILRKELGENVNFVLCMMIPIKNKPKNTLPSLDKPPTHAINYITTLNNTNTIEIMHGIEKMIINERGIHN